MRDCGPARTMACDGARGSRPARGRDTRRGVVPQQGSAQSVEHVSAAPRQSPGELARIAFRARRGRAARCVIGARLATTCPRSDSRESSRTTARLFAAPAPPKIPASWPARGASWAQRARGDAARAACTSTPSTTSGEPHSSFRAWMASSPSRMRISSAAAAAASPTPSPSSALKKSSTYRKAGRKTTRRSTAARNAPAARDARARRDARRRGQGEMPRAESRPALHRARGPEERRVVPRGVRFAAIQEDDVGRSSRRHAQRNAAVGCVDIRLPETRRSAAALHQHPRQLFELIDRLMFDRASQPRPRVQIGRGRVVDRPDFLSLHHGETL